MEPGRVCCWGRHPASGSDGERAACLAGSSATTCVVSLINPSVSVPVTYTNGGSDALNTGVTKVAALYVQDQIEFSPRWQAIVGLRYDSFDVDFRDLRASTAPANRDLSSSDGLLSPRVGLVYKPAENVSLYTSYGVTYLPRSGEQLASLSPTTQALDPEEFENVEVGAKWDINPALSANAAVYRLNRSNVAVVDPANPTQLILLGGDSQRSEGVELSLSGQLTHAWQIIASYAYQDAEVTRDIRTSPTSVTPKGTVLPQTPKQAIGLWNRYDFSPNWGVGLGAIYRDRSFASTSNAVTLKSYSRYDGAIYYKVNDNIDLQLNVENLSNKKYFPSAHSDTNITPGAPRAFYLSANVTF
jgi:catecholate siderophore receptor